MPNDIQTSISLDPAPRFPRRAARRQQTRARILKAALIHFKRVGYADATMNAIAETADVHVTTLFTHFKTKRDLAASLSEAEIEDLEALIGKSKGTLPVFDFFRALVLSTAKSRQEEGDPKMGIGQELQRDPELAAGWLHYEERQIRLIADYIAHDYKLNRRRDYKPYLAAQVLISSGVFSHTRWLSAKGELNLVVETQKALDLAEKMAQAILPSLPATPMPASGAKPPRKPRAGKA